METFSALLAICVGNSPVPGEFPAQWPATRSFDVFFDLRLNKLLSKQSWGWWFETLLRSLWRHRYGKIHARWLWPVNIWLFGDLSVPPFHYDDVIMTMLASQITSLTVVYSTVYSDADQSKHQSSASLAFVWGIHRDRWIPRTKGQLRGKCFHLMTSSCSDFARMQGNILYPIFQTKQSAQNAMWTYGRDYSSERLRATRSARCCHGEVSHRF